MQTFRFRLEKVLQWQRMLRDAEELKIKHLNAQLDRERNTVASIQDERRSAAEQMVRSQWVEGSYLAGIESYRLRLEKQARLHQQACLTLKQELVEQRRRWADAERSCRLLEKLRSRRLAEFDSAVDREYERLATELHLARSSANQRGDST